MLSAWQNTLANLGQVMPFSLPSSCFRFPLSVWSPLLHHWIGVFVVRRQIRGTTSRSRRVPSHNSTALCQCFLHFILFLLGGVLFPLRNLNWCSWGSSMAPRAESTFFGLLKLQYHSPRRCCVPDYLPCSSSICSNDRTAIPSLRFFSLPSRTISAWIRVWWRSVASCRNCRAMSLWILTGLASFVFYRKQNMTLAHPSLLSSVCLTWTGLLWDLPLPSNRSLNWPPDGTVLSVVKSPLRELIWQDRSLLIWSQPNRTAAYFFQAWTGISYPYGSTLICR